MEKFIKNYCLNQKEINPLKIAQAMMDNEEIPMHGPIHHVLDGAAFMSAMYNAGVKFNLDESLDELIIRGHKMPGATCGQWGMCGSSSSVSAALSIIHQTGPLSNNKYYQDNLHLTSLALGRIGDVGGPRCCKRNAFISLLSAIEFVKKEYGIKLENEKPVCHYSYKNKQCIQERCPFYQRGKQ